MPFPISHSPSFTPFIRGLSSTPNPHHHITMRLSSSGSASRPGGPHRQAVEVVPGLSAEAAGKAAEEAFGRHSSPGARRSAGVAIVWFRNDLRLLDNEALLRAWAGSATLLPVYCVDPRSFGTTHYFGFPKTGALRARFLIECLTDLKNNLMKRGLNLLVKHGKPEDVLPSIAKAFGVHTVFAHKETCSEELLAERLVLRGLQQILLPTGGSFNQKPVNPKLQLIWGNTMYHIDDLPFSTDSLPDVYTQFRKSIESKCSVRDCCKLPMSLGPPPSSSLEEIGGWGTVPSLKHFGLHEEKQDRGMHFVGGENAALGRVYEYFWKKASAT